MRITANKLFLYLLLMISAVAINPYGEKAISFAINSFESYLFVEDIEAVEVPEFPSEFANQVCLIKMKPYSYDLEGGFVVAAFLGTIFFIRWCVHRNEKPLTIKDR